MFILRVKFNNTKGQPMVDNVHTFDDFKKLLLKIYKVEPDDFEVYEGKNITDEVKYQYTKVKEDQEVHDRRKLYEELRKEFENV